MALSLFSALSLLKPIHSRFKLYYETRGKSLDAANSIFPQIFIFLGWACRLDRAGHSVAVGMILIPAGPQPAALLRCQAGTVRLLRRVAANNAWPQPTPRFLCIIMRGACGREAKVPRVPSGSNTGRFCLHCRSLSPEVQMARSANALANASRSTSRPSRLCNMNSGRSIDFSNANFHLFLFLRSPI